MRLARVSCFLHRRSLLGPRHSNPGRAVGLGWQGSLSKTLFFSFMLTSWVLDSKIIFICFTFVLGKIINWGLRYCCIPVFPSRPRAPQQQPHRSSLVVYHCSRASWSFMNWLIEFSTAERSRLYSWTHTSAVSPARKSGHANTIHFWFFSFRFDEVREAIHFLYCWGTKRESSNNMVFGASYPNT